MSSTAHASAMPVSGPQLDNRRVVAGVVDLFVALAGALLIGAAAGLSGGEYARPGLALEAVAVAWGLYYYFACESGAGQTLGKKLMRIRVVDVDGTPAGMGAIAARTILRLVDGLLLYLVGLIVMLATGERRGRLGDLAAHTMVVSADAAPTPARAARAAVAAPATITLPAREPAPEPPQMRPFEVAPESLEDLARDVAAERVDERVGADKPHENEGPEDEHVVVRSPETVSAMDLVMEESEPAEAGSPRPPAS